MSLESEQGNRTAGEGGPGDGPWSVEALNCWIASLLMVVIMTSLGRWLARGCAHNTYYLSPSPPRTLYGRYCGCPLPQLRKLVDREVTSHLKDTWLSPVPTLVCLAPTLLCSLTVPLQGDCLASWGSPLASLAPWLMASLSSRTSAMDK